MVFRRSNKIVGNELSRIRYQCSRKQSASASKRKRGRTAGRWVFLLWKLIIQKILGELTIFAQSLQIIRSVPDVLQHEKVQVAAKKASEFFYSLICLSNVYQCLFLGEFGTSTFDYVATTINEFAYGPIPIDCKFLSLIIINRYNYYL